MRVLPAIVATCGGAGLGLGAYGISLLVEQYGGDATMVLAGFITIYSVWWIWDRLEESDFGEGNDIL